MGNGGRRFGGAFIWEVNYDTVANNNSLVPWIAKGLGV
jgi:hypothetical protein